MKWYVEGDGLAVKERSVQMYVFHGPKRFSFCLHDAVVPLANR